MSPLFFESIRIDNGCIHNHGYHSVRMNRTRDFFYPSCPDFDVLKIIKVPGQCARGLYKCRIVYGETVESIEFIPYEKRLIQSLKIIECAEIEYGHKFYNRQVIDSLVSLKGACDDICIVRNGQVTDTSFGNLVFYDGVRWYTPKNPLLCGTKREQLINDNILTEEVISVQDLQRFKKAGIINAMNDIGDMIVDLSNIA